MNKIGVKKFIELFKTPKDWNKIAAKLAKERNTTISDIKDEWDKQMYLGEKLHKIYQNEEKKKGSHVYSWNYSKVDLENHLDLLEPKDEPLKNNHIYLERLFYNLKYGIIGFPDKVEIIKNTINITDYKSTKKLYMTSPSVKIGTKLLKAKYNSPIDHLDDCNYIDAVLQLSLYMYLIWNMNKKLKVGKLYIKHLITNSNGEVIEEKNIEVPYLRSEVKAMLAYKLKNKI